jgi:hypothetical protein
MKRAKVNISQTATSHSMGQRTAENMGNMRLKMSRGEEKSRRHYVDGLLLETD